MIVLYDGTYAGLLTVLHHLFSQRIVPQEITAGAKARNTLFTEESRMDTDPQTARRLLATADKHLARAWQLRRQLDDHLADAAVQPVHRAARRVRSEAHRLKGLLRFRETKDGLLYAPVEPDHNVLPLIAPHFAERLGAEAWLIHDVKRGIGALHREGEWLLADLEITEAPRYSSEEAGWQDLWRCFFNHISIAERRSEGRQKSFMPMKYWKYLVEMEK